MVVLPAQLKNIYFAVRHGKSIANELEIIVSDPKHGVPDYGLAEEGEDQVLKSIIEAKNIYNLNNETIIVSSDFSRAKETAQIIKDELGCSGVVINTKLRERFFGNLEKTPHDNYEKVWENDIQDSSHTEERVESIDSVLERATALILELEDQYESKNILLVSHGDTLQILQTAFEDAHPTQHRNLFSFRTGEIRKLN